MNLLWCYSPAWRLAGALLCAVCFLPQVRSSDCPFSSCWGAWLGAAVLMAALELLRAGLDRRGDDEYLRRQLAGDRLIWRGATAWERALMLTLIALILVATAATLLTDIDLVTWFAVGGFSGRLVGYPHWRAHWQRLRRLAAKDEQARAAMPG